MYKLKRKFPFFTKINNNATKYNLDYFLQKYNSEVVVYPVFGIKKCNYDSFIKLGYNFSIFTPNTGSNKCYYIDNRCMDIFPENQLDPQDDEYNTLDKIDYIIYESKQQAKEAALNDLIQYYTNNKTKNDKDEK